MKSLKILLIPALFLTLAFQAQAQDYNTGIGLRAGSSNGLTVKHFISSDAALEGLLALRWRGIHITGLYEVHRPLGRTAGLNWYFGGGGHIGFWGGYKEHPWFDDDNNYTVIGIDGIIGLEYNFQEVPINLSLDWKPAFNLIGYTGFWGDEVALSIRFIF
ncbi:MAG: hypothetical protein KDC43_26035 [Saprospiraceae bacterium]|nr:hypothetical protein [Saprospiraceae bacterium]MCB0627281.1 hypothetical protein [Saprospiraceae bacterium]